nr:low-density lipoprotein receptor-related protein 1B-like isoform X4 [Labrus bergylta]
MGGLLLLCAVLLQVAVSLQAGSSPLKCGLGSTLCKDGSACILFRHVCDGETDCTDGSDEKDCDSRCNEDQFQCAHGKKCIEQSQVCDGVSQCQDRSDELKCTKQTEDCVFHCGDGSRCLPAKFLCDGERDCSDGTDEVNCEDQKDDGREEQRDTRVTSAPAVTVVSSTPIKCALGLKPCKSNLECVLYKHVCDGEADCKDGSDEEECLSECQTDQFQCAHGKKCIEQSQVCDGTPQCQDRSDELKCTKQTEDCVFHCGDGSRCLPAKFLCDGERDCSDGTDEVNCEDQKDDGREEQRGTRVTSAPAVTVGSSTPIKCALGLKPCKSNLECVLYKHVCDGEADCKDGSDEEECLSECQTDQFQCAHGKKCIEQSQVCDGVSQCQDRSDELKCTKQTEDCVFHCGDGSRCLPAKFLCDGERDCSDGTDEVNCEDQKDDGREEQRGTRVTSAPAVTVSSSTPIKCALGSKPCKSNLECVLYQHVCDGEADCKDGSDEEECLSECQTDQFQCAHGKKCIEQSQVCDGVSQCQDRSDELGCAKLEGCTFQCDDKSRCISDSFLCDGERDCMDASDEANCPDEDCSATEYKCTSGQCVSAKMRCDGYPDCWDRSDEESCTNPPSCSTKLRCHQSTECLVQEWICDGDLDCKDGSDEKDCPVVPLSCGEFQWSCKSKTKCVPAAWKCDGMKDCDDGSDEVDCGVGTCLPHQFQCGSQECLDPALVCNSITNCADGSDEGGSCNVNCAETDMNHCTQSCYSTPQGPRCRCSEGFKLLEDGQTCADINECKGRSTGVCSHLCINTPGSYQCKCHLGYIMEAGGQHCKITGEPFLLASVQTDLYLLSLRSGSLDLLMSPAKRAILSLDYDWREQRVFWVGLDSESIRWSSLDQKTTGTLIKGVRADSVAVDWLGRNLYWIDGVNSQIVAVRLSKSTVSTLDHSIILDEDLDQPRSLALLPQKGLMFWTEIGNVVKIERAGMDGSERRALVNSSLGWPGGVAVDTSSDRVYWTDERLKSIGSATLDGDDIRILQMKETTNPFSLALFNGFLYWTDAKKRVVRAAHKISGKNHQVLLKRPRQPFGVKIVHPLLQMGIDGPCEKMRCSHMCVLAPGPKAVCKCPSGLLLAKDGLRCSKLADSSFLLILSPSTVTQIYLQSRHTAAELKGWPEHVAMQVPSVNEAAILDYSLRDHTLFLTDDSTTSLSSFKLKESNLSPRGQLLKLMGDTITAMALDWVTLNVYWSSNKQARLQVTSTMAAHTAVLIAEGIVRVEAIALHPPSGRVCYVNVGLQGKGSVECANMDGAERVVRKEAVQASSLVFSSTGDLIYWADTGSGTICSVQLDGSGYKEFKTEGLAAVALSGEMLLWMTESDKTRLWYRDEQQQNKLWFEVGTEVVGFKAFSESSQTGSNHCSKNNGHCHHLCLATPRGRTCRCAHDHVIVNDTHCILDQRCPAGSRPCLDQLSCKPAEKFCNGHVDCSDHSDENCVTLKLGSGVKVLATPRLRSSTAPPLPPPQLSEGLNTTLNASGQLRNLGAQQCSHRLCGGNGHCVEDGGNTVCACSFGYSGDSCEDHLLKTMQGPIVYGAVGLCAAVVVIVVMAVVVRRKSANTRRARPAEVKETSMTDLETESTPTTRPASSDIEKTEEAVSSVD